MSEIIKKLRAAFPSDKRPDDELIYELGQWAEQNGRSDIFEQHADFASEYTAIRNEVRRASDRRGTLSILGDAVMRGAGRVRQGFNALGGVDQQDAQDIVDAQRFINARPASPATQEFNEAPDTIGSLVELLKNPIVAAEVAAESIPQSAASIAGMGAGAAVGAAAGIESGPGAFATAAAGAAAGSGIVEYSSAILDSMQQAGMDINNPDSIVSFFGDASAMQRAREFAVKRSVPIAAFDGLTAGLAGRFISPLKAAAKAGSRPALRTLISATGKELAMQAAGGGVGEAVAEVASGQPLSPKNIALEMVAEIASSPAEVLSNLSTRSDQPARGQAPAPQASQSATPKPAPENVPAGELDVVAQALRAVEEVQSLAKEVEAAQLFEEQQLEVDRLRGAANAAEALTQPIDQEAALPETDLVSLAEVQQVARAMAGDTPDFRQQEEARRAGEAMAGAQPQTVDLSDPDFVAEQERRALVARISGQNDTETFTSPDTQNVITPFDETVQAGKVAAQINPERAALGMVGAESAAPVISVPTVETLPQHGIIENARSIRMFEPGIPPAIKLREIADFAPQTKANMEVGAIIRDNVTGRVYQRGIYRGKAGELMIEAAQSTKGAATGKGQSRAASADFEGGTVGRKLRMVEDEADDGGNARYDVVGYTVFDKPQKSAAMNLGTNEEFAAHPEVKRLSRVGFEAATTPKRSRGRRLDSNLKTGVIEGDAATEGISIEEAAKVADEAAEPVKISSSRLQFIDTVAAEAALDRDKAIAKVVAMLEAKAKKAGVKADSDILRSAAADLVDQSVSLTNRSTAAHIMDPATAGALFRSALSGIQQLGADVTVFQRNVTSQFKAAKEAWGIITNDAQDRRLIAIGLESLQASPDAVIKLMHEAAHLLLEGNKAAIDDRTARAYHLAIDRLGVHDQRWLMNPASTDIRLIANSDLARLSLEQRAIFSRLTPEEIAEARKLPKSELLKEQAAEHLAMLGVDKAQAGSFIDSVIRMAKDVLLRIALALQQAFKGETAVDDRLVRAFVENRFLQVVHGDNPIASIRNFIGAPATTLERVYGFQALDDGDFRATPLDELTGNRRLPQFSTAEADALKDRLLYALARASTYAKSSTPSNETSLTRRAAFSGTASYTPTTQFNAEASAINLQEEILQNLFTSREISQMLPRSANPFGDFLSQWIGLPESQAPETRRQQLAATAKDAVDPLTGKPVDYQPAIKLEDLPAIERQQLDLGEEQKTDTISSAQDYAIRQSLRFVSDVRRRVQQKLVRATDRLNRLKKQVEKKTISEEGTREISELSSQIPILAKLLTGSDGLSAQVKRLESKLGGASDFVAAPGATFYVPPSPDADEAAIMKNGRQIPRDLQFANKDEFYGHIQAISAWLANPTNLEQGRIYGYLQRVSDKLKDLAVTPDYVASTFTLRKTWTDSIVGKLRDIGTPSAVRLAKMVMHFQSIMVGHQNSAREIGAKWNKAFADYAAAMGEKPSEAFVDRHWNHLMRTLESINEGEGNPIEIAVKALNEVAGLGIKSEKQRSALRDLVLATIDGERFFRQVFNELGLKVEDPDLKDADGRPLLRRLITQGYATGRRSASKHMVSLYNRMNPVWSETADETFLDRAGLLYSQDRAKFDQQMALFFTDPVIRDFVEPLALNNAPHFTIKEDGGIDRPASVFNVRRAWREAKDDVTRFAELLHQYEGLKAGDEGRTVQAVIGSLNNIFLEVKRDSDARAASEQSGIETTPRQMMDARLANNWPAEWVSYGAYDSNSNLVLLHQLAINAAFGRNGLSPSGEFGAGLQALTHELNRLKDDLYQYWHDGLSEKQIEQRMGSEKYRIAKNAEDHIDLLSKTGTALQAITKTTGYLLGDFKVFNDLVGTSATFALQNPRSALTNSFDVINAPFTRLKLSTPALKSAWRGSLSLLSGGANSVLQAFGSNFAFNADLARRRVKAGVRDPDARITWGQKVADRGYRFNLSEPDRPEGTIERASREAMYIFRRARDLTNVGALNIPGEQALGPKLRPGLFATISQAALDANVDAAYQSFFDLAMKGSDYIEAMSRTMSPDALSRFLYQLESGSYVPTARDLGYNRKFLVLNDESAYAYLKDALETKLYGERGVGQFIVASWRRKKAGGEGGFEAITNAQFRQIANLSMSEWSIQTSVTSAPPWLFSSPLGRAMMVFLTFPWSATQRFFSAFRDPRGRIDPRTVADGAMAMMIAVAPLTLAGSLAFDFYDERILKKKQNIRDLRADKTLPLAALERMARYGTAGFASEIANQLLNYDTAKNLSLDNRIFVVNQMRSVGDVLSTLVQQEGAASYGTVFRPAMQAVGLSGVLHYSQLLNAQLGLNNQEAALNERINTGNYLRSAGRVLDLDVRVFRGGATSTPTPATAWLHQMELAALAGDQQLFRVAYQKALRAAREMDKDDPAKYVADAFADRHPLRRIFKTAPSDYEYRRMLGQMGSTGKSAVSSSINSFNRYLESLGKDAYYGRAQKDFDNPEDLVRLAEQAALE
jgi:hypothetical protein